MLRAFPSDRDGPGARLLAGLGQLRPATEGVAWRFWEVDGAGTPGRRRLSTRGVTWASRAWASSGRSSRRKQRQPKAPYAGGGISSLEHLYPRAAP